jgi:hypothetical protein
MPTTVTLPKTSMFTTTPIYNVGGTIVFGLMQQSIPPDPTDRIITINQNLAGKSDIISNELYGTPELQWTFWELNGVVDPMTEITIGTQLRVATQNRVFNILST